MEFPAYNFSEVASSPLNKRLYKNSKSERLLVASLSAVYSEDEARELAGRLLKRFGSVDALLSQDMSRLENVYGITPKAATLLTLLGAISSRRITDKYTLGRRLDYSEIENYLVGLFLGVPVETVYAIFVDKNKEIYRQTNNAGGIEGGMTNGETLVIKGTMKPIPTMKKSLATVDLKEKTPANAHFERSDVCAVPACSVVAEARVAIIIVDELLTKIGGDSLTEMKAHYGI